MMFPCTTCGSLFLKDEAWKKICIKCYCKKKGVAYRQHGPQKTTPAIDPEMLRRLIQLCHPDKHCNSKASTLATLFLLDLKNKA